MTPRLRTVGPAILVAGLAVAPTAYAVTNWAVDAAAGALGVAHAQPADPPTGVTATCTSPSTARTITVTWNAVPHATYAVYQSTTSATAGYTQVATGLATTTWTSGRQSPNRTYWYEVAATIGGSWVTANSTATAPITVNSKAPFC